MTFIDRLRALAAGRGETDEDLARECGLTIDAFYALVGEGQEPTLALIEPLARHFDTSPAALVNGSLAEICVRKVSDSDPKGTFRSFYFRSFSLTTVLVYLAAGFFFFSIGLAKYLELGLDGMSFQEEIFAIFGLALFGCALFYPLYRLFAFWPKGENVVTYSFFLDKVVMKVGSGKGGSPMAFPYSTIKELGETKDGFQLYVAGQKVPVLIPKSTLSPKQVGGLRKLLSGKAAKYYFYGLPEIDAFATDSEFSIAQGQAQVLIGNLLLSLSFLSLALLLGLSCFLLPFILNVPSYVPNLKTFAVGSLSSLVLSLFTAAITLWLMLRKMMKSYYVIANATISLLIVVSSVVLMALGF